MFGKNKKVTSDFTEDKLPSNRIESFWDILRNHFGKIIELGFIILFSLLPILANIIITNVNVVDIENQLSLGAINELEAINQTFSLYNISNLITIALLLLTGFVMSGCIRIYRKLVWQEGLLFWQDFTIGIKQNIKPTALTFIIIGLINFVLQYLIRFNQINPNITGIHLAIAVTIVLSLYFIPISLMIFVQSSIYNLSFVHMLKNGFLITMRTAPKTFLGILLMLSPWLALMIQNNTFFIIVFILLFLIILPIELLIGFEYVIGIFDQYVNKDNYPTIYEKGIWK